MEEHSKNIDFNILLELDKYYTLSELRYNEEPGFKLDSMQIEEFLNFKDELLKHDNRLAGKLDVMSFNSEHIFYILCPELKAKYKEYVELINSEAVYDIYNSQIDGLNEAFVYSEIEGNMNLNDIEGTRERFDALVAGHFPESMEEQAVFNMNTGMNYINTKPEFTRDNLRQLYAIVSDDCLTHQNRISNDSYYRDKASYISNYGGCPVRRINSSMESLFAFVNDNLDTENELIRFMLPYIAHYYILYIRPYIDCNGRIARFVAIWIAKLLGLDAHAFFTSEALNSVKGEYFKAISKTRDTRNDLTYFLIFLLNASILNAKAYLCVNRHIRRLRLKGEQLTEREVFCIRRIALGSGGVEFTWRDFINYIRADISKQGALKTLNKLESLGLFVTRLNSRKEKIFKLVDFPEIYM